MNAKAMLRSMARYLQLKKKCKVLEFEIGQYMEECVRRGDRIRELEKELRWTPVAEQAPPQDGRVMLTDGTNLFIGCGGLTALLPSITHWRLRPELPRREPPND